MKKTITFNLNSANQGKFRRQGNMNTFSLSQIEGQLTNAVAGGGDAALWNIARGSGPMADIAREVIELATSPYNEVSIYQAINIICNK